MLQKIYAAWEARLALANPGVPPILVYQMGKVGSSTVYQTLKASGLPNKVLHLHVLSQDIIKLKLALRSAGVWPFPYHIELSEAFRKVLIEQQDVQCKIISLVRDPIAFSISSLFQNPEFAKENIKTKNDKLIDPDLACRYLERNPIRSDTLNYVNYWFDRELKQVFDIDVFSEPFAQDVGYKVYRNSKADVLVIRLEDLSRNGPAAIAEFLSLDNPAVLQHDNIRSASTEKHSYQRVLEKISLDEGLCREIYSSRFMKHFYSEEMVETFISKWTRGKCIDPLSATTSNFSKIV